ERLEEELARTHRYGGPLTVVLGETHGRQGRLAPEEAEQVATWMAGQGSPAKRRCDVARQYGPHGFLLLLPRATDPAAGRPRRPPPAGRPAAAAACGPPPRPRRPRRPTPCPRSTPASASPATRRPLPPSRACSAAPRRGWSRPGRPPTTGWSREPLRHAPQGL